MPKTDWHGCPDRRLRLGVLGGSFNPIHFGHLLAAEDVRRLLRLDRVLLVPNFHPPHKQQRLAPYRHRKKMTSLAIAADSGLALEPVEEGRPGPSYTVETLAGLKRLYPGATIFLIVGADQYADMRNWHRPSDLTRLAKVVVVSRPGSPRPRIFPGHAASRVLFRDVIGVQISAAAVRDRLAKGLSVRYMLPAPVVRYVLRRRLYSGQSAGCAPRLH